MLEQVKKWLPFKRGDKTARRAPPVDALPLARLERELHDLVGRMGFAAPFGGGRGDSWFGDFCPPICNPTLDVADRRKHVEVTVELPGLDPHDVEIDVREGALVIRGEKRTEETSEDEGFYRTERSYGAFERAIPLPPDVDTDKAEATFSKGVLKITLPKAKESPASKRVDIKSS